MTRKEALQILDTIPTIGEQVDALDMAIQALEQEPCGNTVSRQAVDELSKELVHTTRDKADFLCNFWEGLQKLPSVNPQPNGDLISRQTLLDWYCITHCAHEFSECRYADKECNDHKALRQLPSVKTKEPKTGHWIMTGDYYTGAYGSIDYVKCSCCHADSLEEGDYCPNCGAKMESEEV